ncbi:MAG: hypothetical protein ABEH77_11370 [Halobacteriaceae archaeon]
MRLKAVPPVPESADALADAQQAVGLVPDPEDDCCARIGARLDAPRDDAREWLTFLRALGLVRRTDTGFVRTDREPTPEYVRGEFAERVFGAREVLAALDGGTTAEAAAGAVFPAVPAWERERREDWRAFYRERAGRLLEWAVLLGLASEDAGEFSPGPAYGEP